MNRSAPRSPLWTLLAVLPSALGAGWAIVAAVEVISERGTAREPGFLVPLVAALGLLGGGWSLVRLLQLRAEAAGSEVEDDPAGFGPSESPMISAQMHRIWLFGVAGSLALVGVLGIWSLADGDLSGLEPGWPLMLVGAVLAGAAQLLGRAVEQRVQERSERWEQARRAEHERRMEDPMGRILEAAERERVAPDEPAPGEVTSASSDSRPESGPSSADTR